MLTLSGSAATLRNTMDMRQAPTSLPARTAIASFALVALLAVPTLASARNLPSGSAVDQYSESIPNAGGKRKSDDKGGGGAPAAIPPQTQAQLEGQGADGNGAAKLAQVTGPGNSGDGDSGSDGLGFILPLILIASLLAAVALYLARRRLGATSG